MKRKLRKISALTVIAAVAFLSFSNWKLIYATVAGDCYMNIGGSKILLKGITNKCYIQNYGPDDLWVFSTDTHVHFAICGSDRNDIPEWGFNFVHYTKGDPDPFVSLNWYEICENRRDWASGISKNYASAISVYATGTSSHRSENIKNISKEERMDIRRSFEISDQRIMTRKELNDLVRSYRFPQDD